MTKKYAIVRVDNYCPDLFEKINNKFVCEINGDFNPACKNCRYGDTKEQLIRKVAQAILRTLKGGEVLKHEECGIGFIKQPVSVEYLAESIVEFLGVE